MKNKNLEQCFYHNCGVCGIEEKPIFRVESSTAEDGRVIVTATQNITYICENNGCVMFINMANIKKWKRL